MYFKLNSTDYPLRVRKKIVFVFEHIIVLLFYVKFQGAMCFDNKRLSCSMLNCFSLFYQRVFFVIDF